MLLPNLLNPLDGVNPRKWSNQPVFLRTRVSSVRIASLKTSLAEVNFLREAEVSELGLKLSKYVLNSTETWRFPEISSTARGKLHLEEWLQGQASSTKVLQIHVGCWIIPAAGTWMAVPVTWCDLLWQIMELPSHARVTSPSLKPDVFRQGEKSLFLKGGVCCL